MQQQQQDSEVSSEDLSVLIDGEKSYEEQNRIGRLLFISLLDTGIKYRNKSCPMLTSYQWSRLLGHAVDFFVVKFTI